MLKCTKNTIKEIAGSNLPYLKAMNVCYDTNIDDIKRTGKNLLSGKNWNCDENAQGGKLSKNLRKKYTKN